MFAPLPHRMGRHLGPKLILFGSRSRCRAAHAFATAWTASGQALQDVECVVSDVLVSEGPDQEGECPYGRLRRKAPFQLISQRIPRGTAILFRRLVGKRSPSAVERLKQGRGRLREIEAKQAQIRHALAETEEPPPDVHPNIVELFPRKVERLAEALNDPDDRRATRGSWAEPGRGWKARSPGRGTGAFGTVGCWAGIYSPAGGGAKPEGHSPMPTAR